jgi:squalene-hopene/tetraprenyl-beta-curcumene cyclase
MSATNQRPSSRKTARVLAALLAGVAIISWGSKLSAAETTKQKLADRSAANLSFRNEISHAIDRGLIFLQAQQNSNGWWSTPDQPAVTALALQAFKGDPAKRYDRNEPAWLQRGYKFLLQNVRASGGIHASNLVTYNTALSMMALVAANKPEYDTTVLRARNFLVRLQSDFGELNKVDDVFDGGIGYGTKYEHSDMGNTLAALEALYHSRHLVSDKPLAEAQDLNWAAAINFLQNCQNLPAYNKQPWASDDAKNKGGFVYYPGHSMAGSETNATNGRVALRSYGSISYGGMLSYIYANLKRDDPRVVAVFDWLRANYTLDENPGMGPQGLYFYLHTMTKALTALGVEELELKDGRKLDWRREVAMKLLNLQQRDGSWSNENARWWEKDPALITSYAVLSLEMIQRKL